MDHLQLEREIASEFNPFSARIAASSAPTMRRETVFSMLSQPELQSRTFADMITEAGYLAAAVLDLEYFAGAEMIDEERMRVRFGSLAENGADLAHRVDNVECNARTSAFSFAVEADHPILIANAQTELRFQDALLVERGLRTGVVCPISYRNEQYGAIGYFSTTERPFSKEDVAFLQSVSLFLGPAGAHQKTERSLAIHSDFVSHAIDSLEAVVVLLSSDGGVLQINRACQTLSGFTSAELRGRRIWSAFWLPDECGSAEAAVAEVRQGHQQVKREAYFLTKQGESRRMAWTFANLQHGRSSGPAILATGIDVTERFQAQKRVEELERQARNAKYDRTPDPELTRKPLLPDVVDPRNRRIHDRRPFQCIQMVAPCLAGELPSLDQFCEVRCYDICPSGFAFLLATRPPFNELVAAFGSSNSRLYLQSLVKHITPIQFDGRHVLLIGCEYVRRVRIPNPSRARDSN